MSRRAAERLRCSNTYVQLQAMHCELILKQVDSDESGSDKDNSEDEVIHLFPVIKSLFMSSQSAGTQLSSMETALAKI